MSDEQAIEPGGLPSKLRGKWVTIRTFGNAEQAHLVKLQLDDAGIPSYIDNENTGTTLWYAQPAIGGIRLRVPAPFEQQAKDALEAGRQGDDDEDEEDEREFPDETDEDELYDADEEDDYGEATDQACPVCHSSDITPFTWGRRVGQAILVLCLGAGLGIVHPLLLASTLVAAIYLLLTKPDYRCLRCGKRWVVGREA
jgi:hypothetical protein